jgi:hypothetical protein
MEKADRWIVRCGCSSSSPTLSGEPRRNGPAGTSTTPSVDTGSALTTAAGAPDAAALVLVLAHVGCDAAVAAEASAHLHGVLAQDAVASANGKKSEGAGRKCPAMAAGSYQASPIHPTRYPGPLPKASRP